MDERTWEAVRKRVVSRHADLWKKMAEGSGGPHISRIYFFPLGQVVVFDDEDKQVPPLQTQFWNALYCELLEEVGWTVEEIEQIEFVSPLGRLYRMRHTDNGWRVGALLGDLEPTEDNDAVDN